MKITICIIATLGLILLGGIFAVLIIDRKDRINERNVAAAAVAAVEAVVKKAEAEKTAETTKQLLQKTDLLEGMGRITHERAQEIRDELTGKVKYYKAPDGSLTTNPFSK